MDESIKQHAGSENKMGHAPMLRLILTMSLPAMFSMLIQALYNIVDSYFVAQISDNALAAVSLAFPVQNLLAAFAVGTSIGMSSLIARRLGEGRKADAENAAVHGIILSFLSSLVFAVIGLLFSRPFFGLFTTDSEIIELGTEYLLICCVFSFGSFLAICLEKLLQSTGNMIWPMIFQLVGAVSNIILDPIFIFGYLGLPAMGVAGAAIATVLGQIIAMAFAFIVIFTKEHAIHITFKGFRFHARTVRDIYIVGFPSIIMQSIGTVMTMAMNGILAAFSTAAYTVFGLYFKLQSFVFMPVFGLTQGLMPIMGYNYGAKNEKRLTKALKLGVIIALIINTLGMALFLAVPDKLLMIFSDSAAILDIGVPALRTICFAFIPAAISITVGTLFQAVGKGIYSLVNSILRQLVILVPLAWILATLTKNVEAVWYAFPVADFIALIVTLIFLARIYRKDIRLMRRNPSQEEASAKLT